MARGKGPRPTLTSLARELDVSPSTVSNAFNRPDQLSPALRERILAAARAAGFGGPDPLARSLRTGAAGAVGLLFTESLAYAFTDPAAVLILGGLARVAAEDGLGLLLLPTSWNDAADRRALGNALVDGLVILSMLESDERIASARARGVPLVVADQPRLPDLPFVGIDDEGAARGAAEHVLALGHRELGVIVFEVGPTPREGLTDVARQEAAGYEVTARRLRGFRAAAEAAGVDWGAVPVFETPVNEAEGARRAAHALLERDPRPTALLCASDVLALGARQAARERGLAVPGDLSLTGFDDVPEAARAEPGLTTIRQPLAEKGARVGRRLLAAVAGAPPDLTPELLPTELVVRGSTAPPRAT